MALPVLEFRQVVKRFNTVNAVDGVSFSVQAGDFFLCSGHLGAARRPRYDYGPTWSLTWRISSAFTCSVFRERRLSFGTCTMSRRLTTAFISGNCTVEQVLAKHCIGAATRFCRCDRMETLKASGSSPLLPAITAA
jgi:hypothetical protein